MRSPLRDPSQLGSRTRPLRWWKFAAGLGAAACVLQQVAPALRDTARTLATRFSEAPSPAALLPAWLAVVLVAAALLFFIADVVLDRLAPRWLLGALVALTIVFGTSPRLGAPIAGGLPAEARLRALLPAFRTQTSDRLAAAGPLELRVGALRGDLQGLLPATGYRDRWFRSIAPTLIAVLDQEGPILAPRPGDSPGTVYLAVAASGIAGWITASLQGDGGVVLLRDGGRPLILGVAPCAEATNARRGGTSC